MDLLDPLYGPRLKTYGLKHCVRIEKAGTYFTTLFLFVHDFFARKLENKHKRSSEGRRLSQILECLGKIHFFTFFVLFRTKVEKIILWVQVKKWDILKPKNLIQSI